MSILTLNKIRFFNREHFSRLWWFIKISTHAVIRIRVEYPLIVQICLMPRILNKNWMLSYKKKNNSYLPLCFILGILSGLQYFWNHHIVFDCISKDVTIFIDCIKTQEVMFSVNILYISYVSLFSDFTRTITLNFMKPKGGISHIFLETHKKSKMFKVI